ncbi:MAG: hypothetical protein WBC73_00400 [Phormidesmis sp.]
MTPPKQIVSTGYTQGMAPLAAPKTKNKPAFPAPEYRSQNPFDYRISLSWFGGLQIHPKP